MRALFDGMVHELHLPSPTARIVRDVRWGAFDAAFTPAFWVGQAWLQQGTRQLPSCRLTSSLREELVACLLGGYGMPAELGLAAFARLRDAGVLRGHPTPRQLERLLSEPLLVGHRYVRYRFARQKAEYVAKAIAAFDDVVATTARGKELRGSLARLAGVGPKTASWIVRNWYDSDDVAILDVHICRACELAGVFEPRSDPSRRYYQLEARFLEFAEAVSVRASVLDNVMWQTMRRSQTTARALLKSA